MARPYIGLFALVALLVPSPAGGQAPGDRVQVSYALPFSTENQSMWGPGTAPSGINIEQLLFSAPWSRRGDVNGIFSAFGFQWGGSMSAGTEGTVGLSFRIYDVGTGDVDLVYPVSVELDLPAPNSFRAGDMVTIGSRFELLSGWRLTTAPPGGSFALDGFFGASVDASGRVCFFGCPNPITLVDREIPVRTVQLFAITSQGTLTLPAVLPSPPFEQPLVIETLPYHFGALLDPIGPFIGFEGPVDAPRVATTASVAPDGRTLFAAGQHRFVDLTADLDQYLTFVGVPPLGFQSNPALQLITGASFGYDIANLELLFGVTQRQTFGFFPRVTLMAQFPVAVPYALLNAAGGVVASGTAGTINFDVGQSLRVTMPDSREALHGTPTYGLDNTFTNSTDFQLNERLEFSAGRFQLHTPSANVTEQFTETVCNLPDIANDVCEFFGGILETVVRTVTHVVPAANINIGPLLPPQRLVDETQTIPLFPTGNQPGQWQLAGLQSFTEADFLLDPEDPRIAVATNLGSGAASGGPAGSIAQLVRVRNEGDVPLSAAALRDAVASLLSGGAFSVISVSSLTLLTNPAFNGGTEPDLLGASNSLAVGAEGEVQVLFGVNPGSIYTTDVHAAGRSPIGTDVTADANDRLGFVVFEIIPDQVSAWSNGVLPTRISSAGIAAGDIDEASLRLEGVAPDQVNLSSSGQLIAKFSLGDVLQALDQRILAAIPIASAGSGKDGKPANLATLVSAVLAGSGELGELRALVMGGGSGVGPLAAANGLDRILVLTGSLHDGTRLVGDDDLTVMNGGQ